MDKLQKLLEETPRLKYLGQTKLKQELKGKGVPAKVITQYFKESDVKQVFSGVNKKPVELMYKITGPPKSFQVDVVVFGYAKRKANKGCAYALMLVDILSRKCWLYPMKGQSMDDILAKYQAFLKDVGVSNVKAVQHRVQMVMGDDQFSAKRFQDFNETLGIRLFTDVAKDDHVVGDSDRLGILDQLVGTLKRQLEVRYVEAGVVGDWLKYIAAIVADYNDTKHRILKMTPNQAWDLPEEQQVQRFSSEQEHNRAVDQKATRFQPGDRVRVLENVATFTKGTKPKWSTKVYTIEARTGYKYTVVGLSQRFKSNALLAVGEKAQDLVVDKTPAKQERARRKITSKKEGIAVDEDVLAGKEKPRGVRNKAEKRTLGELNLRVGEFVVLDAENAADEPIKLLVNNPKKRRSKGYVWAGWVAKKVKSKLHLKFLRYTSPKHNTLGSSLKLSDATEAVDTKVHADALLYRSTDVKQQDVVRLPDDVVQRVSAEYVYS